jgi:hypothetical protein
MCEGKDCIIKGSSDRRAFVDVVKLKCPGLAIVFV